MNKQHLFLILIAILLLSLISLSLVNKSDSTAKPDTFRRTTSAPGGLSAFPVISADNVAQLEQVLNFNLEESSKVDWFLDRKSLIIWNSEGVGITDVTDANLATRFFQNPNGTTSALAVRPDGNVLVWGTSDGNIELWQRLAGTQTGILHAAQYVSSIAFTPDGGFLASGHSEGTTILWDMATQQEAMRFEQQHRSLIKDIAFTPDGNVIAIATVTSGIQLFDAVDGKRYENSIDETGATSVEFSPDGTILAYGKLNGTIHLWEGDHWRTALALLREHTGEITSLVFNPAETLLASSGVDGTIRFWSIATGDELALLEGHSESVTSIALNPNGTMLASASQDGVVKVWAIR